MKSERRERQKIEAERDLLAREVEELRARTNPAVKSSESEGDMASLLSGRDWRRRRQTFDVAAIKRNGSEESQREQEMTAQQVRLTEVHREQEEYARTVYQECDDAVVRPREGM
ncbi:MAG: hypothetical protein IPI56_11065 [Elusimicrobia bacterium]|nr:hypothetical protein [Elusimicrobiota bacterium]